MNNELIGMIEAAADSLRTIGRRDEASAVVELLRVSRRLAADLAEAKWKAAQAERPGPATGPSSSPFDDLMGSLRKGSK